MITLLEEKRINNRFYLNFSLDGAKDMRDLPHHNKPWESIGFNYGIPLWRNGAKFHLKTIFQIRYLMRIICI